jgi:hypothetical protein
MAATSPFESGIGLGNHQFALPRGTLALGPCFCAIEGLTTRRGTSSLAGALLSVRGYRHLGLPSMRHSLVATRLPPSPGPGPVFEGPDGADRGASTRL